LGLNRAAPVANLAQKTRPSFKTGRWWLKIGPLAWVTFGHFLLTCLFTFPLVFSFNKALPGLLLEDRDQNLWNLWWVPRALLSLKNPYHTDYIYYPPGVSLYFHTLHPLNGLLSYPVQILFGLTAAYNFIVFFSFVVGGVGAYALLHYLCRNRVAAFAASLIFAYAPYHLGTLKGLMQLISLEWLPFYILFLLKATSLAEPKQKRGQNMALAVFFLLCTALTDWYYVLFLLIFSLLYLLYPAQKAWLKGLKTRGGITGLIIGLFALLMTPVLWPMLRELAQTSYYLPTENAAQGFSATLAAFFVPPTTSTFLGKLAQAFPAQYLTGPLAAQVYLGYVALALALPGLIFSRLARFWAVAGLSFGLLSLGPTLRLNGPEPGWPMPFALVQNWPIIKITRSPDRFIVITMLALAVCAAFGLAELLNRVKPERGWLVAGLAGLLIAVEFLQIPYPLNEVKASPFFEQLGRDEADYSIIELPAQGGFWSGAPRMANQTIHHKRIFDGYISREYEHPFVRRTPGFQELALLKERPDIFRLQKAEANLPGEQSWYAAFSYYKVRYLVLYYPQTQKELDTTDIASHRQAIKRIGAGEPIYKDGQMEVYNMPTPGEIGRKPFAQIGENWYEAEPDESGGGRHRWAAGAADLNLLWQGPGERAAHLSFKLGLLAGEQALRITLDGATVWEGKATAAQQSLELNLKLSPGSHRLDFYPQGQAQSPKTLGLGPDPRKLLFYIGDLGLS